MKVSTRSVGKAKKVKKVSAALHEAIKADKITPDAAEQIVDIKDANVRQEAITAVVTGDPAAAKAITKKTQDPKRHTTPYVYSDVLTALEGLPKRLRKFPPDAHVYGQLAEAFTAAIADLRAYEQTLTTSEPANDA